MKRYRTKDSIIAIVQAVQFDPCAVWPDIVHPFMHEGDAPSDGVWGYIETAGGGIHIRADDWIVKHNTGYFFVCKPDIFKETYEVIEDKELMSMKKYVIEVRLMESEYEKKNEDAAIYYNYDCSWAVEDGVLIVRSRPDNNLVASFAAGAWQHIKRINE